MLCRISTLPIIINISELYKVVDELQERNNSRLQLRPKYIESIPNPNIINILIPKQRSLTLITHSIRIIVY